MSNRIDAAFTGGFDGLASGPDRAAPGEISAFDSTLERNSGLQVGHGIYQLAPLMAWKRKIGGGIVAIIGFMLSPLSWWNDLFVNVPLALGFAWIVSLFYRPAFETSLIVGYWLTNVIGFVLMHKGTAAFIHRKQQSYTRRDLLKDVGISLAYTALIVCLVKFGILKPIENYFPK